MKYCVIKGTKTILDEGRDNLDLMMQNAKNAGFTESEIEIIEITKEEIEMMNKQKQSPTLEEKNRADIDYLSIMAGVGLSV